MIIEGYGLTLTSLPNISESVPGANLKQHDLLHELIAFAESIFPELNVEGQETLEEQQKLLALVTLVRLQEVVQAIAILAAHGAREELKSNFRIFLDAYWVHANICNDVEFIGPYLRTDDKARLKLLNSAKQHSGPVFHKVNELATPELKGELEQRIKDEGILEFQSQRNAQNVGCGEIYNSMFRLWSASVHTTPRCLENYIQIDDDGKPTSITHRPDPKATNQLVYDAIHFFIKSLSGTGEVFDLGLAVKLDDFENRLEAVQKDVNLSQDRASIVTHILDTIFGLFGYQLAKLPKHR